MQEFTGTPVTPSASTAVVDEGHASGPSVETPYVEQGQQTDLRILQLEHSTDIATPDGWRPAGSLVPGDRTFRAGGLPTPVRATTITESECFLVHFDDRAQVIATPAQPWQAVGRRHRTTLNTSEMAAYLAGDECDLLFPVPVCEPLQLPHRDLPISMYALGLWLADGKRSSGEISKPDEEIWARLRGEGYEVADNGRLTRTARGLRGELRQLGLLDNKHVPFEALWGSHEQRLALLQGLMDGDGTWNRTRRQAVFSNTNPDLARAVEHLVASLGWKPRTWELQRRGFGLTVTCFDVTFTPFRDRPFRLKRKASLIDHDGFVRSRRRLVRAVEPLGVRPIVEVAVTEDSLLTGHALVPFAPVATAAGLAISTPSTPPMLDPAINWAA